MKIAIIGFGFVGSAIAKAFTKNIDKFILDPKHFPDKTIKDLIEFKPDASFIAVPTPEAEDGSCDATILKQIIQDLNQIKNHLVIIKSTIPINVLQAIQQNYSNLRIIFTPEFLTEQNSFDDFCNPPMHIFGGNEKDASIVEQLYLNHSICSPCPIFKTSMAIASLVKYCINSFLASKVIFMNEFYNIFQKSGEQNWDLFTKILATDQRIGNSHLKVPGKNKEKGYGGKCFPKDTKALAFYAKKILNTPFQQLEKTIEINKQLRKSNRL